MKFNFKLNVNKSKPTQLNSSTINNNENFINI